MREKKNSSIRQLNCQVRIPSARPRSWLGGGLLYSTTCPLSEPFGCAAGWSGIINQLYNFIRGESACQAQGSRMRRFRKADLRGCKIGGVELIGTCSYRLLCRLSPSVSACNADLKAIEIASEVNRYHRDEATLPPHSLGQSKWDDPVIPVTPLLPCR
jgi:hypothetical protein